MSVDGTIRHDWTDDEVASLLSLPLLDLVGRANAVHRAHHAPDRIQRAALISVKTGGCPEDCAYCSQSAHHDVDLTREHLKDPDAVIRFAETAKAAGAERVCMAAAWREVRDGPDFDAVIRMVEGVRALGVEACVSLGRLSAAQARRLAAAGLTAYNHNLDTGPDYYPKIVSTRSYADRLETLANVRAAGVALCCGGIIGLGESVRDRAGLLRVLASLDPHPEHVPINALVTTPGTPLADRPPVDSLDIVRMVAAARLVLPDAVVRLAAGRRGLGRDAQILCHLAGANSLFLGERLLTTPNAEPDADQALLACLEARPFGTGPRCPPL